MSLAFNNWHSFLLLFGDITWKIYYLPDQWISRCSVSPCTRSTLSTEKASLSEHGCSWFLTHKTYIKATCSSTLCSISPFLHLCVYLVNSWIFWLVIKRRNYFKNYRIISNWKSYRLTKIHLVACLGLYEKHLSGTQQASRELPCCIVSSCWWQPPHPARLLLCWHSPTVCNSAPWQSIRPTQGTLLLGKQCSTHIK